MSTALDIIKLGLKDAGIIGLGQQPLAEDINDAFTRMNSMLSQWQLKRYLVWHLVDVSVVSTGAQSYTVGPGGAINVAWRPDRLEYAYLRQYPGTTNPVDTPMQILEAREDYAAIPVKNLGSFGYAIFYDAAFPLGSIFPYPIPQASIYEIHLLLKAQLTQFASLTTQFAFPPEYFAALEYGLAYRLRAAYRMPEDPAITKLANSSLRTIRGANMQIKRLTMPSGLLKYSGQYNIYTDSTQG